MLEYLSNIIPRIKQFSKGLDKAENFVDKNWIFIDEKNNQHEYIFLRDKRLIMTLKSVTQEGTWELLPTGQLLIKRSSTDLVKLENIFVENALLILKQSAIADIPFILINQNLIPDLDVVSYLESFEHQEINRRIPESEQIFRVLPNGELVGPPVYEGKLINTYNNVILTGTYKIKTEYNSCEKFAEIVDNRVKRTYFHVTYFYNNKEIIIEQKEYGIPFSGYKIVNPTSLEIPVGKLFEISSIEKMRFSIQVDSEYLITKSNDGKAEFIMVIAIFIVLPVIALLIWILLR